MGIDLYAEKRERCVPCAFPSAPLTISFCQVYIAFEARNGRAPPDAIRTSVYPYGLELRQSTFWVRHYISSEKDLLPFQQ